LAFAAACSIIGALFWRTWEQSAVGDAVRYRETLTSPDAQWRANASQKNGAPLQSVDVRKVVSTMTDAARARAVQIGSISITRKSTLGPDSAEFSIEVEAAGGYTPVKMWLADLLARPDQIGVRRVSINKPAAEDTLNVRLTLSIVGEF
jgi:hypothetical protein